MRKYVFIGIGGFLGAVARYLIKSVQLLNYQGSFPLNTLLINLTGSFLLAFVFTVAAEIRDFDDDIRLGIGTGFIGAYTTFSTMCKESVNLLSGGNYFTALCYILISTLLGLTAVYSGHALARKAVAKPAHVAEKTEYDLDFESDVD